MCERITRVCGVSEAAELAAFIAEVADSCPPEENV
jgi:hypothetical protein